MNYFIRQFGKPEGGFGRFLSGIMNLSNNKMYKANIRRLKGKKRILEIGFGNGKQMELIRKVFPEAELYGVDISKDMFDAASKRLENKADLQIADACRLPYQDGFYDAVITTDTFYFWKKPEQVLQEICRVLSEGGIFVNTYNRMYAASVGNCSEEDCMYRDIDLITSAERVSLQVKGQAKIGLGERQIVFRKE